MTPRLTATGAVNTYRKRGRFQRSPENLYTSNFDDFLSENRVGSPRIITSKSHIQVELTSP